MGDDSLPIEVAESQFIANLVDWCAGGPKPGGYTREGRPVTVPALKLGAKHSTNLRPTAIMAKNGREFERWHLGLLRAYIGGTDLTTTAYWQEYLLSRLSADQAHARVRAFVALFESVRADGVQEAVRVADVRTVLKFPYFRFDGAHRTACAEALGYEAVPAIVYETVPADTGSKRSLWSRVWS
jgi:hypothetical protein